MSLDELRIFLESKPTSLDQLREKLRARLLLAGGPARLVNETELLSEMLGDVESILGAQGDEWLGYEAASRASGYSPKHLQRLAVAGKVESKGSHRNRCFRRGSLPMKPAFRARSGAAEEAGQTAPVATTHRLAPRSSSRPSSTPAPTRPATTPASRPVAVRRGHPYDPTADAQRFARLDASMRKSL
jgi:hypothetical protein